MGKVKEAPNPFYILLIVAGIVFAVTACAYGVMAFHAVKTASATVDSIGVNWLLEFMAEHGTLLLGVELGVLAIATVGAIGTDQYWTAWQARRMQKNAPSQSIGERT